MKREFLEDLGVEKEAIDKIMAENGKDIEKAKEGIESLETKNETLQGQLDTANETIEEFEEIDVDDIKKTAKEYKEKFEKAEKEAKEELDNLQFNHQLENAIRDSKARNVEAVKALLDIDSLKDSKNQAEDIKAAIEATKEENDFLFNEVDPDGTGGSLGAGEKGKGKVITKEEFEEMDYHEKRELYNKDLELYRELAR